MKRTSAIAILQILSVVTVIGQDHPTAIVLINSNISSGAILRAINEHCHNLVLTIDATKADYELEAQISKESENRNERSWLTLFNKNGEAVFVTDTHGTGNAVKDVCAFLKLGKP